MNRPAGLLRQHELRASQQVAMKQSTQSLARIEEFSSTPPMRSQRTIQQTNMFITRLLDECGLELKMSDEENMTNNDELTLELKVDQGILAKNLSQRLRSSSISVKQFETELIAFFSNESIFRSALLPTSSNDDVSPLRSQQQDSLIRILLCVDEIQMFLAKYLLKRLVRFDNKGGDRVVVQNLPLSMIRLILQTFHYLPIGKLTNAKELLYFYLDVIDLVTNNESRCQMIALVTDIFCDDFLQLDIVHKLEEKFDSTNVDVIKQVLSTLTTIPLDESTDRRIREKIIPMIMTSVVDVKVECFNYLFETSTKINMFETILLFRDVATISARRSDNFPSIENLFVRFEHYFHSSRILFRTCQEKHPITADLCLKVNSYFLFDFFIGILLVNRSFYNNLKTFVKKLGEDSSIVRSISTHLTTNFSFVVRYANEIFRFAVAIFQHLSFGNFPPVATTNKSLSSTNLTHLQIGLQLATNLIEILFSHSEKLTNSNDFHEQIVSGLVRMAILFQNRYLQRLQILKLLKRFAVRFPMKIISCESFLKNLFEYIDIFRGEHLRLVLAILASLYNTGVYNDLNIFVTKCLIQPHKDKSRGVFGAIEIFRSLLIRHVNGENLVESNHENELKDLLALVQSSGMQCPQTLALFYDELAAILGSANVERTTTTTNSSQIDSQSLNWFALSAADMFQEAFLTDSQNSSNNSTRIAFSFEGQTANASILNMSNIIANYHQYRTMSETSSSPILLAPMLRLIVLASWSNIDQVDAVLQCSLRIPDVNINDQLKNLSQSSLTILCDVFYYSSRLFREILNLLTSTSKNLNEKLVEIRLEQLTNIEENFRFCVEICREQFGFYQPICSTIEMKKLAKNKGKKRTVPTTTDDEIEENLNDENEETTKKKPRTSTISKLKTKTKTKTKISSNFDIFEFDIRPLEEPMFPLISNYVERLSKSTGSTRLTNLRCISTIIADLHRLLTEKNPSISSIGMIKKRFQTHQVPGAFQTQGIQPIDIDENVQNEDFDDKIDSITFESFQMFFRQILTTFKGIERLFSQNDDDDDDDDIIDRDPTREIASRMFFDALESFYFLLNLFKVKQNVWQKEIDKDTTCFDRLMKLFLDVLLTGNIRDETKQHVEIFEKLSSLTKFLNLLDSTRLCQSLELFVQLFDDETQQDDLYKLLTIKCRKLLEESSLDANSSVVISNSKLTSSRAVEILLNLYLLHLESNEITPIIDGFVHYSLKILTRADRNRNDENETMDEDETTENEIVDLATWNVKSTFTIYFRCLFKHFLIKARSIKMPNDSKKKENLENICAEWLELNELFRKFVSFVSLDEIYRKNAPVTSTILRCSKQYIDVFRARAMPTLDLYFLHDTHGTKQLLTVLQKSTRLLQSLCNMVKKDQKHLSCIRLVPALKRTLEMLMCRAKLMVDVNNCPANVFCIGQLKAKDLKGNELTDVTYRQVQEETSSMIDDDSNDVQPDQDDDEDEDEDEPDDEE